MRIVENKKTVIISFAITADESKKLTEMHEAYEHKINHRVSVSEYVRLTMFIPHLNGNPLTKPTSELESEPISQASKYSFNMDDV
jgi:hypothetical protein